MTETVTAQLLKSWHGGHEDGLDALLERHLPWIRIHVRRRLGPLLRRGAETSDYVQDAMIEFLRYGPRIVISDDDHFRALIVRIVENSLRNKYDWFTAQRRAIARERPIPSDTILRLDPPKDSVKTPSQSVQRHEDEAWVRLCMELIDPEDSEIIILRQWEHLSFVQIGEKLGISANTARMRHNRAVNRLAEQVGNLRRRNIDCLR